MPVKDGPSCPGCGLPNYSGLCPHCRGDEDAFRREIDPTLAAIEDLHIVLLRWRAEGKAEGQVEEREAVASLGEDLVRTVRGYLEDGTYDEGYNDGLADYAAAIRARGGRGE